MATGLLGDTLSYIRLFAIGLTGSILGGVFNTLAFQLTDGLPFIVKFIAVFLILLVGHSINFGLCMISSFVFAVYLIVSKKLLEKVGVVTMMKYIFGGAAVSGIIVSSVAGWDAPMFAEAWKGEWHWTAWAVLAFILIFPTYLSYFLVPVGLKYLKTTVVAIYSYLILVVTTVVSLSLGQDRFSWTQAVAIAMICISVYFVEVAEGNSKKPDTPLPPQS